MERFCVCEVQIFAESVESRESVIIVQREQSKLTKRYSGESQCRRPAYQPRLGPWHPVLVSGNDRIVVPFAILENFVVDHASLANHKGHTTSLHFYPSSVSFVKWLNAHGSPLLSFPVLLDTCISPSASFPAIQFLLYSIYLSAYI